jgi:hypothetical protein
LITGYQAASALFVADKLGLIELLENGRKSADELALATGTHPPALYRFLRALATIDLLEEHSEGSFSLGPLSGDFKNAVRIDDLCYPVWAELSFSLKTGKAAFPIGCDTAEHAPP